MSLGQALSRLDRKAALRAQDLFQHVESHPGQTYLDVGCGNGAATLYVARLSKLTAAGVDIDEEEIALAQEKGKGVPDIHFQVVNAEHLPFPDASFDYVACQYVMHHVPGRRAAFQELVRVTKPGGYVLFSDLRLPLCPGYWKDRFKRKLHSFPKREEIESFARDSLLVQKFSETRLTQYDLIWQKPT
ncbi:MAG: class I SAM-dependent methyltransferase [Patescibacteria group bacterium]